MLLNSKRIYSTKLARMRPAFKTVTQRSGPGGILPADLLYALPWQAAILDHNGVILAVNEAWRRFAAEKGVSPFPENSVGLNYFDTSRQDFGVSEETAQQAYDGIREVLTGKQPLFTFDYLHSSQTERRWLQLTVTPLANGQPGALIQRLDISAHKQAESARAEAMTRERATSEASRQMELFLALASHEFRTPLTVIKGQLQLAGRKLDAILPQNEPTTASASASAQESLDAAQRAASRLGSLLDDLLEVSNARAGRLTMHPEWCDLVALVRDQVADQRQLHPTRCLRLHLTGQRHIFILADPVRLAEVLTNYLNNACKYSPDSRPIQVVVSVEGDIARVSVRDQGPGISPAAQARVWERFYQAPDIERQSGSDAGMGIGLYISRLIAEQHGGEVGVESAVGKGATFWCTVPLKMRVL